MTLTHLPDVPPRRLARRGSLASLVCLALASFSIASAQGRTSGEPEPAERGLVLRTEGATAGYKLFAPLRQKFAVLVDADGNEVRRWTTDLSPTGAIHLRDDGSVFLAGRAGENPRFQGGGMGGVLQERSWNDELTWEFELANDYQTMHHDFEPLPNGNILVLVWEHRYPEDVLAAGRDPAKVGEGGLWPDAVLEIVPERPRGGEVVWEWHTWDHLIQDLDPARDHHGDVTKNPGRIDINADHRDETPMSLEERERLEELEAQMRALGYVGKEDDEVEQTVAVTEVRRSPDWLHTNSVDYHPDLDLILLSVPHLNEVWVVDHSTETNEAAGRGGGRWGRGGELLWRWGNPRNYGRGTNEDQRFFYQHDARWMPAGGANRLRITVFNNGGGRPDGDWSSVEELVLPFDSERGFHREPGGAFGPAKPSWIYSAPGEFYSGFISGAQRLPSGNTVICSGVSGRIFEVTPDGETVWEYFNPYVSSDESEDSRDRAPPSAVFRATHISPDHPGLGDR